MQLKRGALAVQMLGSNDSAKSILEGSKEEQKADEATDGAQGKAEKQNGAAQVSCAISR